MEFIDKRIQGICNDLSKFSVIQKVEINELMRKHGNYLRPEDADNEKSEWEVFESKSMHWYGPDKHDWFRFTYVVPKQFNGKPLWINVRTQIEEWDDAKNPQFLLFVNGEITQGIDMNHRRVLITKCANAGEEYTFDMQAYTGTLHSEFRLLIDILEINSQVEGLYYDLLVPLRAFTRMEKDDKVRRDIETILNNCINIIDLRQPKSEEFLKSVDEAREYIAKALYDEMAGYSDIIATCIGHTHIDVAWWWTVEQTREKVARSFATVLKLMEEYPNYKFISSQPQLYQFLKERYPELYSKVKEAVSENRWETEGGMWIEADCNLTSGESLVRQFLYGKKFFKEEFGVDNEILWLPDVFGYSGALPQIMDKCGIKYFMTTKLAWNQMNQMPYDTLYWKGIDGTKIFTHLITTLGVGQSTDNFFTTYNGMLHPDAIMGGWTRYQNKEINNDILISYGYGDGGGGPTRDMLETSIRMEKGVKGIPKVRQAFAGNYFKELEARVKGNKRLPVWEGEFYFEYHRGTYTSMARNKKANRKSEFMLMDLEFFASLAAKLNKNFEYPRELIEKWWKVVLLNQFHDILPGTSIKEVYEVTKQEYELIEKEVKETLEEIFKVLVKDSDEITVFNTLGFVRDDIVALNEYKGSAIVDAEGNKHPVQKTKDGAIAYIKGIPSKGRTTYHFADRKEEGIVKFKRNGNAFETPFYKIMFDENGQFISLYDKDNEREVIKENKLFNLFRMYEDKPMYYDNWDIDMYYTEKSWDVIECTNMEWTEIGAVRATLLMERKISNSTIRQKIYFYSNSRRIDFDTYVDWKEHQHLLKVDFPVDVHTDEASFDIQFGNLTRKVHTNTSWDQARFESCGQKWIDLSEGHYGVSLINDCKYGHSVSDGTMSLTLIKSGIEPNPDTDCEEHVFTYAIYPHSGNLKETDTIQQSYKLNQPAYCVNGTAIGSIESLISIDKSNIIIETIKEAEDKNGMIVRLYECENCLTKANISIGTHLNHLVYECNLIEEIEKEVKVTDAEFQVVVKPYEIKTYRIV